MDSKFRLIGERFARIGSGQRQTLQVLGGTRKRLEDQRLENGAPPSEPADVSGVDILGRSFAFVTPTASAGRWLRGALSLRPAAHCGLRVRHDAALHQAMNRLDHPRKLGPKRRWPQPASSSNRACSTRRARPQICSSVPYSSFSPCTASSGR